MQLKKSLFNFFLLILVDVVMIDSIRSDDGFGVSKYVDRNGPPADEVASNLRSKFNKCQEYWVTRSDLLFLECLLGGLSYKLNYHNFLRYHCVGDTINKKKSLLYDIIKILTIGAPKRQKKAS